MLAALDGFGERITYCPVVSSRAGAGRVPRASCIPPPALPAALADYEFYFAGRRP
jgi:hypothetical protein